MMADTLHTVARAAGLDPAALQCFLEEQIYTLRGTERPRERFSIVLTGSRATGLYGPGSDVDIDVLCPRDVYDPVAAACHAAGIIRSTTSFFCHARGGDPQRYFGPDCSFPHFSLQPLDRVKRAVRTYDDVPLWIWTNAKIIADPRRRFSRALAPFAGYPPEVLQRKLKYYWLRSEYAAIDVFPHHPDRRIDLLPAINALTEAMLDLIRVFFLVEGRPFPYAEKLMRYAPTTTLGAKWSPTLHQIAEMIVGTRDGGDDPWDRLHRACGMLVCDEEDATAKALWEDCSQALVAAGVDPGWVDADFSNIGELLSGDLGPPPQ